MSSCSLIDIECGILSIEERENNKTQTQMLYLVSLRVISVHLFVIKLALSPSKDIRSIQQSGQRIDHNSSVFVIAVAGC